MPIPGHRSPARRAFGGIHTPTMKQPTSMWLFPHQQAEKSLQNQHVLSILQVGCHQLQYRFFRTNKPKSRHKTNTFCPLTQIARLGRTQRKWKDALDAYFDTGGAINSPTEAINGHYRAGQTHRQRLPQPHQRPTPNAPHRRRPRCLHPHSTLKSHIE